MAGRRRPASLLGIQYCGESGGGDKKKQAFAHALNLPLKNVAAMIAAGGTEMQIDPVSN
jgi:hypothetical protein